MASAHAAALPAGSLGVALLPGGLPTLASAAPAAAAALLTLVLGLAFGRLSWWAGLLVLGPLAIGLAVTAVTTTAIPVAPIGPLLLAVSSAYAVGLLGARGDRDHRRRDGDDPILMPRLAVDSCAAILTIDGEGIIRSCNPAAERMFGYPGRELAGLPFRRLLAGPEQDQHRLPVR